MNARGESQHFRYDRRGLLIESERPDGHLDRYERDSAGQIIGYTDPAQQTTRYHYDLSGRVKQRTDAQGFYCSLPSSPSRSRVGR
ncbi:RHS repeat domain-containing protein [Stenotrophomonas sp. TWI700]|uniref:RHS repeat domain-containing protein n=1 Tax=Stenotrophomonas sp. TWI700 TaxID=3136792 RepID=UPI00320B4286